MKTARLAIMTWLGLELVTMAAYEYVWVDTNIGVYKPAWVESDQHSNVQATTGRFDVLWVGGAQITGTTTSTPSVDPEDGPVSSLTPSPSGLSFPLRSGIDSYYLDAKFWYSMTANIDEQFTSDDTGNNNHGAGMPQERLPAWTNYALSFSRIDENYIAQSGATNILSGGTAGSLGLWIKLDSPLTNQTPLLMSGGRSNLFGLYADSTNIHSLYVGLDGAQARLAHTSSVALADGNWHRVVSTFEKTGPSGSETARHCLWIDDSLVASNLSETNFFLRNQRLFIGINSDGLPGTNGFIDGMIDDVFALSRALTGLEITNDFARGRSMMDSEWSKSKPATAYGISPANGSTIATSANQQVTWSASSVAEKYYIQWGFSSATLSSNTNATVNSVYLGGTKTGSNYYWRILSSNTYGISTSSISSWLALGWSPSIYTQQFSVWFPFSSPSNVAADASPVSGTDNWSLSSDVVGITNTISFVPSPEFYIDMNNSAANSHANIIAESSGKSYAGTYGFTVGFWLKLKDKTQVPSTAPFWTLVGDNGTHVDWYPPAYYGYNMSLLRVGSTYWMACYINVNGIFYTFLPQITADLNQWNHFMLRVSPQSDSDTGGKTLTAIVVQNGHYLTDSYFSTSSVSAVSMTITPPHYIGKTGLADSPVYRDKFISFDGYMDDYFVYAGHLLPTNFAVIVNKGHSTIVDN